MNRTQIGIVIAMAIFLAAPTALAGHFTVARTDRDAGGMTGAYASIATWNDDGSDVMPLFGLGERLTTAGSTAGDGVGFVLDARVTTGTANSNVGLDHYLAPVTGANRLYPGVLYGAMAWYGNWLDKNSNGIMDDYTRASANPADEFAWHGAADGNPGLNMLSWVYPSNPDVGCTPTGVALNACRDGLNEPNGWSRTLGAMEDPNRQAPDFGYADRSAGDAPGDEAWLAGNGFWTQFADESTLMTTWIMTVANAKATPGAATKYEIDPSSPKSDELRDVDKFESVNPEVEALYISSMAPVRGAYKGVYADYLHGVEQAIAGVSAGDEQIGAADDLVYPGLKFDGQTCAGCDFTTGFAPFLDVQFDTGVPIFNVIIPTNGQSVGIWGLQTTGTSPTTASGEEDRTAIPSYLFGLAVSGFFHDINGDGWIGDGCPFETARADGEPCENPYDYGTKDDPNNYGEFMDHDDSKPNTEWLPHCAPASNVPIVFTPVDAPWPPGALLSRQYNHLGGATYSGETVFEPLTGFTPASIRPDTAACNTGQAVTQPLDAIIMPAGSQLGVLKMEITAFFPAFSDIGRGIDFDGATITDVDFIIPVL